MNAVSQAMSTGGDIELTVDARVYSVDAILKTVYKFSDRVYARVAHDRANPDLVFVALASKVAAAVSDEIEGEFWSELADQELRVRLERQFGPVRALIVAHAFSEGNLLDSSSECGHEGRSGDVHTGSSPR